MKRIIFLLALLSLLAAACAASQPLTTMPSAETPTVSATFPPTQTSVDSTPAPPTPTATPVLIDGVLTLKVNVRSGPGTSYASLGLLNAGEKVQIAIRDVSGAWYQIILPTVPDGRGWVAAQYVQIAAGAQIPLEATPTQSGPAGRVMQRLHVRSGPGLTYSSLGTLEPNALVSLTGKNAVASWFQVKFPASPGGYGWVTAQYIQTDASGSLPVLDDYGTPVASGPPAALTTPTPTVGPAYADNDSSANPAIRVVFSLFGTLRFVYASQVSAPNGDPEDWLEFTPFSSNAANARLVFRLACSGNGALNVEIWQNGSPLSGWGRLACGDPDAPVMLPAGQPYLLRLTPAQGTGLQLVNYVLSVENLP